MTALSDQLLADFRTSTLATIAAFKETATFFEGQPEGKTLLVKPIAYVAKKVADFIEKATRELCCVPQYHEVLVVLKNRELTATSRSARFGEEHRPNARHNSVRPTWDSFVARMNSTALHKTLCDAFTDQKRQLLHGRSLKRSTVSRIKDLQFVEVKESLASRILVKYVTQQTFDTRCRPLVDVVLGKMMKEGYLLERDAEELFQNVPMLCEQAESNVLSSHIIGAHPVAAISHIFVDLYARTIALERAKREGCSMYIGMPEDIDAATKTTFDTATYFALSHRDYEESEPLLKTSPISSASKGATSRAATPPPPPHVSSLSLATERMANTIIAQHRMLL
jgi:hypothetical protein